MPASPHIVTGTIFDIYGNILSGATVTLTHATITPVLTATSDSNGQYNLNLGNLDSQWSVGQNITLQATKTAEGTKSVTVAITTTGSQTNNITLSETSNFNYETHVQDRYALDMVMLTHYDGLKITRERGLPVYVVLERKFTQKMASLSTDANKTEYIGEADPGTATSVAKWRIQKIVYSGDFTTDVIWASGNQNFDKVWDNRTTYSYS